jgi:hypothetical protein
MRIFENLTEAEKDELLKFPAYVSLLAANAEGGLDKAEKKAAIHFSHIKTYSCHPMLWGYYHEADKVFEQNITQLDEELPRTRRERILAIKDELVKLEKILLKLGEDYTFLMLRSMKSFKDHVSKAHHNVLEDFIFPLPIKGLTERPD